MQNEAKLTKKEQITIPKNIREKLELRTGDKVICESTPNGIMLRKKEIADINKIINEVADIWKDHPIFAKKTSKEIVEMLREPDDDTERGKNSY